MTSSTPEKKDNDTPSEGVTAGTLREWIKQEILSALPGNGPSTKDTEEPSTKDGAPNIAAQVKAALQQLEHKKTQEERDKAVDEMLKKYNEPPQEKPPVERRWIEKFMGWGEREDAQK